MKGGRFSAMLRGFGLSLMLCFHSNQFRDAVQRRRGAAADGPGQSGHLLPSQRRSGLRKQQEHIRTLQESPRDYVLIS